MDQTLYVYSVFRQTVLDVKTDLNSLRVGNCNNPFSAVDRRFRHKINKVTSELNGIIEQMDLADIPEYSIQILQNTCSSLQYIELSLKQTQSKF